MTTYILIKTHSPNSKTIIAYSIFWQYMLPLSQILSFSSLLPFGGEGREGGGESICIIDIGWKEFRHRKPHAISGMCLLCSTPSAASAVHVSSTGLKLQCLPIYIPDLYSSDLSSYAPVARSPEPLKTERNVYAGSFSKFILLCIRRHSVLCSHRKARCSSQTLHTYLKESVASPGASGHSKVTWNRQVFTKRKL